MKQNERAVPAAEDRRKEAPAPDNVVPLRRWIQKPADAPQDRDPPPDSAA